jgi:phage-related protein
MRTIEFYTTLDGKSPIQDFLDTLPSRLAQKVLWTFKLAEEIPRVPEQYFKKLAGTDELWEIRVHSGHYAVRFLGFWKEGNLIILTNGFIKKTQKTPQKEIATATQRKSDYLSRQTQ